MAEFNAVSMDELKHVEGGFFRDIFQEVIRGITLDEWNQLAGSIAGALAG